MASALPRSLTTADAGTNFANLTGNLPDVPVNAFAFTPVSNRFFVGSTSASSRIDAGVTASLTQGSRLVPVTDLVYHAASNRLRLALYGRGIWTLPLITEPLILRGDVVTATAS
ncbi:MAG: hypothetical protein IPN47_18135 [Gemmatimonadetes bacterium]|nr:hypothetical protein [Gemmatimonadota bacterium]